MSLFSICISLFWGYSIFQLIKRRSMPKIYLLTYIMLIIFLSLFSFFDRIVPFTDDFKPIYLILFMVISSLFFLLIWHGRAWWGTRYRSLILLIIFLFVFTYSEFFNGIETFSKYSEFQRYKQELLQYHNLMPIKIKNMGTTVDLYTTRNYCRLYTFSLEIRDVAFVQDKLYFRVIPYGAWYQYGIPIGQQI